MFLKRGLSGGECPPRGSIPPGYSQSVAPAVESFVVFQAANFHTHARAALLRPAERPKRNWIFALIRRRRPPWQITEGTPVSVNERVCFGSWISSQEPSGCDQTVWDWMRWRVIWRNGDKCQQRIHEDSQANDLTTILLAKEIYMYVYMTAGCQV